MKLSSLLIPACALALATGCDSSPSAPADAGHADAASGSDATMHADAAGGEDAASGMDASTGTDASPADTGPLDGDLMLGQPIVVPVRTWSWIDFPESACDDGSPTGIGVSTSSTSSNVLIFLNGGGACWDYDTCFTFNTATHGPFGMAEFSAMVGALDTGAFSRGAANNYFRDWNLVFVPYCTGDVHAGDNVATYTSSGGDMRMYHHVGHSNFVAFVRRLAPTFPHPAKIVLSGSSAGGFGATFNYSTLRDYWPTGQAYLIDDSGPPLEGDAVLPALREAWFNSWHIESLLDPLCGPPCRTDLSAGLTALSVKYPNDRLALLSSLRDQVIRTYFGLTPEAFQAGLLMMSADVLDPTSNFKYFFVTGQTHTMLGSPDGFTSNGTTLTEWLRQEVSDDPAWASTKP